jgi:prophage antirepressor-like protein
MQAYVEGLLVAGSGRRFSVHMLKNKSFMTNSKEQNATSISKVFNFSSNNQPIQVEVINNEPYFVATDVGAALTITNVPDALSRLDKDEKLISVVPRAGQKREVN